MSYPRDIDEMTESELKGELALREERRQNGWCDYCARSPSEPPCMFPKRHYDSRITISNEPGDHPQGETP